MVYNHAVIANGMFYPAGVDVPDTIGISADAPKNAETTKEKPKRTRKTAQEKPEC